MGFRCSKRNGRVSGSVSGCSCCVVRLVCPFSVEYYFAAYLALSIEQQTTSETVIAVDFETPDLSSIQSYHIYGRYHEIHVTSLGNFSLLLLQPIVITYMIFLGIFITVIALKLY